MRYTFASNVSKIVQKYVQPVQKLRRQIDGVFVYHAPHPAGICQTMLILIIVIFSEICALTGL